MVDNALSFETTTGPLPDSTTLQLHGPVLISNLFGLQNALRTNQSNLLVVDLSDVPYLDSAGLGTLVNAYVSRQHHGRKFALLAPNHRIMALLKLTRMDSVLPIFSSTADARF